MRAFSARPLATPTPVSRASVIAWDGSSAPRFWEPVNESSGNAGQRDKRAPLWQAVDACS
jgi:hypothetical protein